MPTLTPANVYREYETAGVPSSGAHKPKKAEIIQLLETIQTSATTGAVATATKAELDAITDKTDAAPGFVYADPTAGNNGIYTWDLSGTTWMKLRGLPDTAAVVTNIAGTANAITGDTATGIDPGVVQILILPDPPGTNTGAVTIALNGAAVEDVNNAAGGALTSGDIVAGKGTVFFRSGTEWRQIISSNPAATFDHQGDYDNGQTYTEGQITTGSNGKWYQLKTASATGDDPVSGGSGNWLVILDGLTLPDGYLTDVKVSASAGIAYSKLESGVISSLRVRVVDVNGAAVANGYEAGDTVDGVMLAAGDLILRATEGGNADDGVWVAAASGAAARSELFPTYNDLPGVLITVQEGDTWADTQWLCISDASGSAVLGTDALTFRQEAAPARYIGFYNGQSAGDQDLGLALASDPKAFGAAGILNDRSTNTIGASKDADSKAAPCPVIVGDEIYVFYEGYDGTRWTIFLETYDLEGNSRNRSMAPIIDQSFVTSAHSVRRGSVIYEPWDTGAEFKMVFGYSTTGVVATNIALAKSSDGYTWTLIGNAFAKGSGWEASGIGTTGRLVNDNGTYHIFYFGLDASNVIQAGEASKNAFTAGGWTKNPNNPLLVSRGGYNQSLTANLTTGSKTVKVADSSLFDVGAPVMYWYTGTDNNDCNIIDAIPDSTTLTLRYPSMATMTTANSAAISQIHSRNVDLCEVWKENGKWKTLFTAFNFRPSYQRESVGYAETADLDSGFTIDPTAWPLPLLPRFSNWDRYSRENLKFVRIQ